MIQGRVLQAGLSLLVALFAVDAAHAWNARDVAGTLNGEPVTLGEVDEAVGGAIRKSWGEIDEIVRASVRAICDERAEEAAAVRAGRPSPQLRADLWAQSRAPEAASKEAAAKAAVDPLLLAHAGRVRNYRQLRRERAAQEVGGRFTLHLPTASTVGGEPALPDPVATCLGAPITRDEVERYASFPLYRRRAGVVATSCRQFEIDYSIPLVLHREATRRGVGVEEMLRGVESVAAPDPDQIEAIARSRYGNADGASLAKVRLALGVKARADARLAFIETLRKGTKGACALTRPAPPVAEVRGLRHGEGPEGALRVVHFGAFRCRLCGDAWRELEGLRTRWKSQIRIEFAHHFPDMSRDAFGDALHAVCSEAQGRFTDYAAWRFSDAGREGGPAPLPGLDGDRYQRCLGDPATAVRVLDDIDEGLRLGFREAIPSWVVGRRPRRGFQGAEILDATVREELVFQKGASQ